MKHEYQLGKTIQTGEKTGEVICCVETGRSVHVSIRWEDGTVSGFVAYKRKEDAS